MLLINLVRESSHYPIWCKGTDCGHARKGGTGNGVSQYVRVFAATCTFGGTVSKIAVHADHDRMISMQK